MQPLENLKLYMACILLLLDCTTLKRRLHPVMMLLLTLACPPTENNYKTMKWARLFFSGLHQRQGSSVILGRRAAYTLSLLLEAWLSIQEAFSAVVQEGCTKGSETMNYEVESGILGFWSRIFLGGGVPEKNMCRGEFLHLHGDLLQVLGWRLGYPCIGWDVTRLNRDLLM